MRANECSHLAVYNGWHLEVCHDEHMACLWSGCGDSGLEVLIAFIAGVSVACTVWFVGEVLEMEAVKLEGKAESGD